MKSTVLTVLENAQYRTGSEQEVYFEKEFAEYVGAKHAVAVTSGAGALHIAASMLGIGPGDEVITAANTFTAAADCAVWVGAKPVFADIDRDTFNIDPSDVRKKITHKTKAIIPAHMYGHPADMDPIIELAEQRDLIVIEDAAQAAGADYKGEKTGKIGHIGIFSFAGKNMHCYGEGGMLTTSNDEYAKNAVLCRHFGHLPDQFGGEQHVIGYNYTLSGWNAAMGRITLRLLDEWNSQRRRNAEKYSETLKGVQGIETPVEKDWGHHVYLHYVIRAERRDRLKEHLTKKGIETVIHYPIPIPHQKTYRAQFGYKDGMYPLSEEATARVLSLPTRPTLTDEELQYIVNAIREFYA